MLAFRLSFIMYKKRFQNYKLFYKLSLCKQHKQQQHTQQQHKHKHKHRRRQQQQHKQRLGTSS